MFETAECLYSFALRRHSNVGVPLQHGPAHVAHERKHGALRNARLGHFGGRCVPQVMEAAFYPCLFADAAPDGLQCRCGLVGSLSAGLPNGNR